MSMRIAPPSSHATSTTNTDTSTLTLGAPSAPGIHDTLRYNSTSSTTSSTPASTHPLESRLLAWRQTQESLKLQTLRRVHGLADPIRRGMELKMVREADLLGRPAVLGSQGCSIHEDILVVGGRETEVAWEDVFVGGEVGREPLGFHEEMEGRVGMGRW